MDSEFSGAPPRRLWPWLLLVLLAFLGGLLAAGYALGHNARAAGLIGLVPQAEAQAAIARARRLAPAPAPSATAASAPIARGGAAAAESADTRAEIALLEEKVDAIETQARAATGDASRAEGLLVAFAARRALDRGLQLGYIEGLLRQRFGHDQAEAVATLLSAARQPVTLAELQTGLDAIAPQLASGESADQSWWRSLRQAFAGLVVIRRSGEPANRPADRVARAQRLIEAGQVDGALAEIIRLPDHRPAAAWIGAARRYLAGRGALDRIETAALLDPGTPPAGLPIAATAPSPAAAAAPASTPTD
ncbi:hypothetical protein LHA26_07460 [Sphingomonas morindae]|uniref:Inner membrane protein n=1 Tax=Sphingomonas morindae TaxID=1541170 RepID=A0ABY4XBC2_9SPHN|nr:hypothetical protein [Sphingomonas morindae]USI74278.1 hypothetical protein LHA26_07460 [Sphingomonas morindae]